ncbi:hypothetical protein [Ferrimonas aestuarii]|uniref:hypothetical protein n=1 Tax=Ferrimonas aestuarii TaxID=2569539 RepID=UPI00145C537A|nr:hypothetical protein [Ferrimonas aestuarii]
METNSTQLSDLLHDHFRNANSIPELRERLRDIEEELHQVFADELAQFAKSCEDSTAE